MGGGGKKRAAPPPPPPPKYDFFYNSSKNTFFKVKTGLPPEWSEPAGFTYAGTGTDRNSLKNRDNKSTSFNGEAASVSYEYANRQAKEEAKARAAAEAKAREERIARIKELERQAEERERELEAERKAKLEEQKRREQLIADQDAFREEQLERQKQQEEQRRIQEEQERKQQEELAAKQRAEREAARQQYEQQLAKQQEQLRIESQNALEQQRAAAEQAAKEAAAEAQNRYNKMIQEQEAYRAQQAEKRQEYEARIAEQQAQFEEIEQDKRFDSIQQRQGQRSLSEAEREAATTSTIPETYVPSATVQGLRPPVQFGGQPYGVVRDYGTPSEMQTSVTGTDTSVVGQYQQPDYTIPISYNVDNTPSSYQLSTPTNQFGVSSQPPVDYFGSPADQGDRANSLPEGQMGNLLFSNITDYASNLFNKGGSVNQPAGLSAQGPSTMPNTFKGFKPSGMKKIADKMGYTGDMNQFQSYVDQDPMRQQQMQMYQQQAMNMAKGGMVKKYQTGGTVTQTPTPVRTSYGGQNLEQISGTRMEAPGVPQGSVVEAAKTGQEPGQFIAPQVGQVSGQVAIPTAMAQTSYAQAPLEMQANLMQSQQAAQQVDETLKRQSAAQGTVFPDALVTAQTQDVSSINQVQSAQGTADFITSPVQRSIQQGELIGQTANANVAAAYTEQIQAAEATPSKQATVAGQLEQLTANFDAKNPPSWAAGAMRNATAQMAARGLGASSIAGQAIVQATIESALPIAQADAATQAQFESQNLSNRQQRAMLAAQQRAQFIGQEFDQAFQSRVANAAKISDIANLNFTAEQQVQLENARAANTMNLNNLSNRQALVMAEAAALANLDQQNLGNRQQAAVQNAQNFLQMDMTNLSNEQQMRVFSAQSRIQSLFTDQAAENAARQFNATNQNQVDQFFSSLANNVSQFNSTQANAQAQYNAGQRNVVERFNAELNNQRDQFNASNQLEIAQNNAVWRRQIATADTAQINRVNEINARNVLDISNNAYDNLWNFYSDIFEYSWTSGENEAERANRLAAAKINADANMSIEKARSDAQKGSSLGSLAVSAGKAVLDNLDTITGWF